ncbi:carbohydrate ABC transporter permease [Paenibacillus sp. N1-5-1-14]|nr:carbohydrate ABC transporter permease [Paenibacillus radicibacter]MCR8645174.1 carbohydrate ABC transporter permease [Paenibacillus radicibacter]
MKKSVVWIILSILFVTQVYPLVWLLLYAFKTNAEILDGQFFALPNSLQWVNFKDAYVAGNYLKYLGNSILVTGVTMVLTILLSTMAAYAIARFRFRLSGFVMLIFMVGIMIPIQSTLLPLMIIFKNIGVLNTYFALIIPYIAFSIPLSIFILTGFMRGIPHEIEESAIMDGASIPRLFLDIILPISIPPVVTVCILTFISVWNEYIMAATFISSEKLKTLPFGVYSFFSQYSTNYSAIGAYLVLAAIPVLIVYFTLSEKITSGMVAGAVKG